MKQVYVILSDDYFSRPIMVCTSLESAEAIAEHIYNDHEKACRKVCRVPFLVDTDRLFDDYEYRDAGSKKEE